MKLIKYEVIKNSSFVGNKYGKLTILEERKNPIKNKHNLFLCKCDCGKNHQADKFSILNGNIKSCGCLCIEHYNNCKKEDKRKGSRLYNIWQKMKARCYNNNYKDYKMYGARGVTICDEWLKDYDSFKEWALNNGYDKLLTIDRIDSNKGYFPNNCRWITIVEQAHNRQTNTYFKYNNVIYDRGQLAIILNVKYNTLSSWYYRHGNLNKYGCINSSYEEYINQ